VRISAKGSTKKEYAERIFRTRVLQSQGKKDP